MGFLLSFLARRIAQGLFIVLLVSFGIFAILRLVPGDPVRMILGPMANATAIEDAAKSLGLRDPIPIQYFHWLGHVVRGDLGTSFSKGKGGQSFARADQQSNSGKAQVSDLLWETVPMTLQLAGLALVFTALIALPLGIAAGLYPGRIPDKLAFYIGSIFVSVPNFWCALVLVLIISAQLNLLPAIGYQGFAYTILPAIVIAIELSPIFMRALAVSIASVTRQNFIQLETIRGIPAPQVFFHHTIRNAAVPILNLFGVQIGALLSGVLIVEYVFDYPGFGLLTVQAVSQRDFPVIQGVALLSTLLFVVINILVDLVSTWIDPRLDF
jgi:peptide/nickel transport system permease protein